MLKGGATDVEMSGAADGFAEQADDADNGTRLER